MRKNRIINNRNNNTKSNNILDNNELFNTHFSEFINRKWQSIPDIDSVKKYAIKLALKLPKSRYVGWDISITDTGLEVIEGNICPSAEVIQCGGIGVYDKIKFYLQ